MTDRRATDILSGPKPWLQRVAWFLLGACLAGLLVIGVITAVQVSVSVDRIREVQAENVAIAERVESCTTPGGECYEEGNQRTGQAVGTINEITIFAAACAKRPENTTAAEIRGCVEGLLGHRAGGR